MHESNLDTKGISACTLVNSFNGLESELFRKLSFCDEVVDQKGVLCKDSIFRRKTSQLCLCMALESNRSFLCASFAYACLTSMRK